MPAPVLAAAAGGAGAGASAGFSVGGAAGGAASGTSTSVGMTVKLSADASKYSKVMGDVGKDSAKAGKTATEGFQRFEGVLGKLPGMLATVTGALLAFFGPSEVFRTMMGGFIELWGVWIDVLLVAFLPVWEVFIDEMVRLIPVIEEVAEAFAPVITDLAKRFADLFEQFRPEIEAVVAAFFSLVALGLDIWLEINLQLLQALLSIISLLIPQIEEMFTPENIAEFFAMIAQLLNDFPSIADDMQNIAGDMDGLMNGMPGLVADLKAVAEVMKVILVIVEAIKANFDSFANVLGGIGGGLGTIGPTLPGGGLGALLGSIPFLGGFQHGGVAPATGLALVHAGEPIGESAGGVTIIFNEGAIVLGRNVRREDAEDFVAFLRDELRRTGNTSINTLR